MLNNIIMDIMNLRGREVGKGTYFHHTVPMEVDKMEIDIIDVLKNLKPYEIETMELYDYEEDAYIDVEISEYIDNMNFEEVEANNSYNWLAPVSNHFNYNIYKDIELGDYYIEFKVHRFGDVRCNYTESCYLQFEYIEEFYEILIENNKYLSYTKDGIEYQITVDILSDTPIIYNEEENEELYGHDAYEFVENIEDVENIVVL